MTLCVTSAALALSLAVDTFTLSWIHSVERTEWRERWHVDARAGTLALDEARVRGSGAGMEPPDGAVLRDGWWVYRADRRLPALRLATSGATGSGWRLCTDDGACRDLERWLAVDGRPPSAVTLTVRTPCVAGPPPD